MSTVDIVTLTAFGAAILLGLAWLVLTDALRKRPRHQMRARLQKAATFSRSSVNVKVLEQLQRAQAEARRRRRREALGELGYYLDRLDAVAGHRGSTYLSVLMIGVAAAGLFLLLIGLIPPHWWTVLLALVGAPAMIGVAAYRWLVARFRNRFLGQLPDAMDMIVRASRAGIPVTQSIRNVGLGFDAPLGPEFRKMGDSLLLGGDLEDVLDAAALRVELPDFSFFSVCVLLQRESGGSVSEALENLSAIIRARRDLALKARALTAEGRMSGLIMSLLPFFIIGMLYSINRPYVEVLFITEAGRKLLWVAAGMLLLGVVSMRKLSRMEV